MPDTLVAMVALVRPQPAPFFRICALVLFTWAGATVLLSSHWWTISVEHLRPMWIPNRAASLGGAVAAGLVGAAITAYGLSSPGFIRILAWSIVTCGFVLVVSYVRDPLRSRSMPLLSTIAVSMAAATIASMLLTAMLLIVCWRWLGPVRLNRRHVEWAGTALLLGTCLWAAAVRTGFLARIHAAGKVDVVLFVPVVLTCLGLLGLTWHRYWQIVFPPEPQLGYEGIGVEPILTRQLVDPLVRRLALLDLSDPSQEERRAIRVERGDN